MFPLCDRQWCVMVRVCVSVLVEGHLHVCVGSTDAEIYVKFIRCLQDIFFGDVHIECILIHILVSINDHGACTAHRLLSVNTNGRLYSSRNINSCPYFHLISVQLYPGLIGH